LFRVAGLLELADEEFTGIKKRSVEISASVAESLGVGNFAITLDGNSLRQYLERSDIVEEITKAAIKAGFDLPAENFVDEEDENGDASFSQLAWYCSHAGISTISELDRICRDNYKAGAKFLKKLYAASEGGWVGTTPWFIQLIVMFVYSDLFDVDLLVMQGWGRKIAERVMATITAEKGTAVTLHKKAGSVDKSEK
jgi:hypothetical protein